MKYLNLFILLFLTSNLLAQEYSETKKLQRAVRLFKTISIDDLRVSQQETFLDSIDMLEEVIASLQRPRNRNVSYRGTHYYPYYLDRSCENSLHVAQKQKLVAVAEEAGVAKCYRSGFTRCNALNRPRFFNIQPHPRNCSVEIEIIYHGVK